MEKLFHTTTTWEKSEQAYHEAIMNMMEGDVGAQTFRLKDLSLQDIIDTLIAKYDTTHRTPEELNEELCKIKREKHQSPYQFRQVIESMFKQMIAVQPIPESDAQLRVLLRERLLANVGEKTKRKLEKLMARCHLSGCLATVDELYECVATSEAIKKDWVKGPASKVSVAKSYMPDVDEVSDEEDHHQEEIVKRANFRGIQERRTEKTLEQIHRDRNRYMKCFLNRMVEDRIAMVHRETRADVDSEEEHHEGGTPRRRS